jgi:tRNA A-37 threonylcarbamoyl transferase component Bud32
VGAVIAAFHREGVHHADLNANNILLSESGTPQVYLLDFDRGRIRERGAWEGDVLARLKRSLDKIKRLRQDVRFSDDEWASLMEGYARS